MSHLVHSVPPDFFFMDFIPLASPFRLSSSQMVHPLPWCLIQRAFLVPIVRVQNWFCQFPFFYTNSDTLYFISSFLRPYGSLPFSYFVLYSSLASGSISLGVLFARINIPYIPLLVSTMRYSIYSGKSFKISPIIQKPVVVISANSLRY